MMATDHDHGSAAYDGAFALGVALNIIFVITEAVFGVIAGSTALLADAAHNFSDVLGLLLAWGASYLARRPRSPRRTYGWRSSSILAALVNAIVLLVVTGGIAWEAVQRFSSPAQVGGGIVAWVALVGVGINTATATFTLASVDSTVTIDTAWLELNGWITADAGHPRHGLAVDRPGGDAAHRRRDSGQHVGAVVGIS
ncbi:MAG: cation diffusion facilitator family transporter [Acidobacteria bacterium]|nr:cation diffusion facilitator family transporter [Acidobacteriota bacterium]